jgi:hypothetical protein
MMEIFSGYMVGLPSTSKLNLIETKLFQKKACASGVGLFLQKLLLPDRRSKAKADCAHYWKSNWLQRNDYIYRVQFLICLPKTGPAENKFYLLFCVNMISNSVYCYPSAPNQIALLTLSTIPH